MSWLSNSKHPTLSFVLAIITLPIWFPLAIVLDYRQNNENGK
jgi:hypothetical protein